MDVALRDCPACNAVVMGDDKNCPDCGAELPPLPVPVPVAPPVAAVASPSNLGGRTSGNRETPCPKCGMMLPQGVLRCRDCGAYLTPEIEQAAMARMASRMYGGRANSGFAPVAINNTLADSSFSTVADDDDFDLNPDISFTDGPSEEDQPFVDLSPVGDELGALPDLSEENFALKDADEPVREDLGEFALKETGEGDAGVPILKPIEEKAASRHVIDEPEEEESDLDFIPVAGVPLEQQAAPKVEAKPQAKPAPESVPLAAAEAAAGEKPAAPKPTMSIHSEATGGDALLNTALEEQEEAAERAKGGRRRRSQTTVLAPGRFLVFCPNGHRIQVQDKHRGRTGRCPNCKTIFFVPAAESSASEGEAGASAATEAASAETAAPVEAGYSSWITDVLVHRVSPQKLKLTPGSLVADGFPADLGVSSEHLLLALLFKGGGPFRSMQEPKQKAANRKAMLEHFASGKALVELKLPEQLTLSNDQLQQLKIVQPTVPGQESLFADVPVFGEGRIGLRLPALDTATEKGYLSLGLSQFRALAEKLGEVYGLGDFGAGTSIPMEDQFEDFSCHYSEAKFQAIPESVWPFYKADTARPATVLGHKCEKCGLIVSEDSRKKEKVGSKSPDSVAKAKCPKCKQKMGNHQLHGFPVKPEL